MQLLKTALSVTVISVCLYGCTNPRLNLSSRDVDDAPLPMITDIHSFDGQVFARMTAVDKKPLSGVGWVHLEPGPHEVEYQCGGAGGRVNDKGRISIDVEPGTSYLLRGKELTQTDRFKRTEFFELAQTLVRDPQGRLVANIEPVYLTSNQSVTRLTGCGASVLVCKGYAYLKKSAERVVCMSENIGAYKSFVGDYVRLF